MKAQKILIGLIFLAINTCACAPKLSLPNMLISKKISQEEIREYILKNTNNPQLLNKKSVLGWTPLHIAIVQGSDEIAKLLIISGADLNAQTEERESTPLHFAVVFKRKTVVKLLLAKGANPSIKDKDGNFPFQLTEKEDWEIIEMFNEFYKTRKEQRQKEKNKEGLIGSS